MASRYAYWIASSGAKENRLFKAFSIVRYGEEQAMAMAIAAREKFVRARPNRFLTKNAKANELAETLSVICCKTIRNPWIIMPVMQAGKRRVWSS